MRLQIDTDLNINLFRLVPLTLVFWPAGNAAADRVIARYAGPSDQTTATSVGYETYLSAGDEVAGYKVHPVRGTVEPHYGIDLATPAGTRMIAPEGIRVVCWWDTNGGGEVATVEVKESGEVVKLLHLSSCLNGTFTQGATFARTGSSGEGTGPHLDVRRGDQQAPTRADIEPFLTGKPAKPFLSDEELVCSIGAAEGTRNRDCSTNEHYNGHVDPGNGADNLGTFSYQHGASSPEDADQRQLVRLRGAEKELQVQADAKWNQPLSKPALAAALDLWNQSPKAAGDFVGHLPSPNPTKAQIVQARAQSYVNPTTGQLNAPGLGNNSKAVEADQARRTDEVMRQLGKE
mgnify:CR=1 FL=1